MHSNTINSRVDKTEGPHGGTDGGRSQGGVGVSTVESRELKTQAQPRRLERSDGTIGSGAHGGNAVKNYFKNQQWLGRGVNEVGESNCPTYSIHPA